MRTFRPQIFGPGRQLPLRCRRYPRRGKDLVPRKRWRARATVENDGEAESKTRPTLTTKVEEETSKTERPEEQRPVRYSGLRGNPLSCGVNNATGSYNLPTPAVAARNLVEQVQFAHLCTIMSNKHHRRAGYPFGALVDFVCDGSGFPVLRLSSLAVPARNAMENPRCSLVVQIPGWSGLSNARLTLFGDVYQLPPPMEPTARKLFMHQTSDQTNILTGNTLYFRMHDIKDIYFVGGFGTVQWIDVDEYIHAEPDAVVSACTSHELQALNSKFVDDMRRVLSRRRPVHEVEIISVDAIGADVRTRTGADYGVVRVNFAKNVRSMEDVKEAFTQIVADFNSQRKRQGGN